MPGVGGDPHLTGFDGRTFDFAGTAYTRYVIYDQGNWLISALMTPGPAGAGVVMGTLWIEVGTVKIQLDTDGHIRVEDADYAVNLHALGCSLPAHLAGLANPDDPMNGVAYLNLAFARFPTTRTGQAGAIVDGDAVGKTPADYVYSESVPP